MTRISSSQHVRRPLSTRRKGGNVGGGGTGSSTRTTQPSLHVIECSATSTIACAIFLMCIGGVITGMTMILYMPHCFSLDTTTTSLSFLDQPREISSSSLSSSSFSGTTITNLRHLPSDQETTKEEPYFIPSKCTTYQMERLRQQIGPAGCADSDPPWLQLCSFTQATRGCKQRDGLRKHLYNIMMDKNNNKSNNNNNNNDNSKLSFLAIMIGCEAKMDTTFIDILACGSHDANKYSVVEWEEDRTCRPKPIGSLLSSSSSETSTSSSSSSSLSSLSTSTSTNNKIVPTMGICFQKDSEKVKALRQKRDEMGWNENDLMIEHKEMTDTSLLGITTSIDEYFTSDETSSVSSSSLLYHQDQPIHYMIISDSTSQTQNVILDGAVKTLSRIWILEFEYHWNAGWKGMSLQTLLDERLGKGVKKGNNNDSNADGGSTDDIGKGFICYWNGNDNELWRITDCWQDHYQYNSWAYIICVNSNIAETQPILKEMEKSFEMTLQKKVSYGEVQ